ncbi:hypothetical protein SAMN00768000_2508 [Sulfobacillus thermosulfidooxidans DSM 9293]|uniref:DUF1772 domain-containing protein n=1 Tax=Sulfobacillus thermosulfidooxidans (strain DSM 9293 / VKM B-1269 / AT-1) TaxID=929705 RepID=A0A1W1WHU6_SULTA|nr:hypothetical protein [Sulfobacillus thermosulfidooxidans]SMC05881.1 hypothetical protein SAMN00768000_2508 [Sulfobacillus thermosulfidooxidans DSM 9293]
MPTPITPKNSKDPMPFPTIPWRILTWWILILPVLMVLALIIHSFYLLLFSHVMAGSLWTGADIFLGFLLGPIWKHLSPSERKAVQSRLIPKTLLYMPVLGLTTGTAGWYVAQYNGFATTHSTIFGWIVAAGFVTVTLTVVGLGIMLPTSLSMLKEMARPHPDPSRLTRLIFRNRRLAAVQGLLQVTIILIMVYLTIAP